MASDTPLTDAKWYQCREELPFTLAASSPMAGLGEIVPADFARDLERVARQNHEALVALYDFARRRLPTGHIPPQAALADAADAAFQAFEEKYK